MDDGRVHIYQLADMPRGRAWAWFGTELLVIEAHLDEHERRAAIDEAFRDLHARTLGGRLGRPVAA